MVSLREAREDIGFTLQELAEAADLPRGTIWNWESGRCVPSDFTVFRDVAKVLGVPARRIFLGA